MDILPNEVLSEVLQFLDKEKRLNCRLVNRSWCDLISTDPYFKSDRVLNLRDCHLAPGQYPLSVISPATSYFTLKLGGSVTLHEYNKDCLSEVLPGLKNAWIDVSNIGVTVQSDELNSTGLILLTIIDKLAKLELHGWNEDMDNWVLDNRKDIEELPNLTDLCIYAFDTQAEILDGLELLLTKTPNLKQLTIKSLYYGSIRRFIMMVKQYQHLTLNFHLRFGKNEFEFKNLTTARLVNMYNGLLQENACIKSLSSKAFLLYLTFELNEVEPIKLINTVMKRRFDLTGWGHIKNHIQRLYIDEMSGCFFGHSVVPSPTLHTLHIGDTFHSHCNDCTQKMFLSLINVTDLTVRCVSIAEEHILSLIKIMKNLSSLEITLVCPLSTLEPILSGSKSVKLKKLYVGIVAILNEDDLKKLAQQFSELTFLSVAAQQIANPLPSLIRTILKRFTKLQDLVITFSSFYESDTTCAEIRYVYKCIKKFGKNLRTVILPTGNFHKTDAIELFNKCHLMNFIQVGDSTLMRCQTIDVAQNPSDSNSGCKQNECSGTYSRKQYFRKKKKATKAVRRIPICRFGLREHFSDFMSWR